MPKKNATLPRDPDVTESIYVIATQWRFAMVPTALLADPGVDEPAKLTYAYLQLWGRADGRAWPNRSTLAAARRVARSTLYAHLGNLEAAGWLVREPHGAHTVLRLLDRPASRYPDSVSDCPDLASRYPDSVSDYADPGVRLGGPEVSGYADTEVDKGKERRKDRCSPTGERACDPGLGAESPPTRRSEKSRRPDRAAGDRPRKRPAARSSKLPAAVADAFEAWWAGVPRKSSKGAARRAWPAALRKVGWSGEARSSTLDAAVDVLTAGRDRWVRATRDHEPRYVKHPSTWLNGECWDDEPDRSPVYGAPSTTGAERDAATRAQDRERARVQAEHDHLAALLAEPDHPRPPHLVARLRRYQARLGLSDPHAKVSPTPTPAPPAPAPEGADHA